ncbi:hypothetical protein ACFY4C_36810 [Actinomadura viridis]|uniref:hypothetical protein n=1 Tax=Actinomadura viridis TaxID=58110 RepID=UPI0036C70FFF
MDDRRLAEALRARDPGAPGAVYDAYADRLYAYCRFLLRERDAAQVALRDAFIVAEAHVGELRDPDRFGAWLYAVARLECGRRMPVPARSAEPPPGGPGLEDAEQRAMAWEAVQALEPFSRELLELRVRHGLVPPDIAEIFGLTLKKTQAALDRAHRALEVALTAELLAHHGPYGCAERAALLRERQGGLDPALRERLVRHAGECQVCGPLSPRTVSAPKVFGLLPRVEPPEELRLRVMSGFLDPELVGYRLFVATRAADLSSAGFPVQLRASLPEPGAESVPGPGRRPVRTALRGARRAAARVLRPLREEPGVLAGSRGMAMAGAGRPGGPVPEEAAPSPAMGRLGAGAVAAALVIGGGAAVVRALSPDEERDGRTATGSSPDGPGPTAVPQPPPPESGDGGGTGGSSVPVSATYPLGALATSAPPLALASPPARGDAAPGPGAGGDGGGTVPRPGAGTLAVSPLFLDLADRSEGTIELRADGGPVNWSATAWGGVRTSAASGRIEAGRTVRLAVRVSRTSRSQGEGGVSFRPGGVDVRVGWRPVPPPAPTPTPTPADPEPTPPPGSPAPGPTDPRPPAPAEPPPASGPPPEPEAPPASEPATGTTEVAPARPGPADGLEPGADLAPENLDR